MQRYPQCALRPSAVSKHSGKSRALRIVAGLMTLFTTICLGAHAEDPNPSSFTVVRGAWTLYRDWTPAEFRHFSRFIENIYDKKVNGTRAQVCAKLPEILSDPEMNLLLSPEFVGSPCNPDMSDAVVKTMHQVVDCGKLTVALYVYYAYRRGLPWMQSYVRAVDGSDVRTAPATVPLHTVSTWDFSSLESLVQECIHAFCTGNFRVEPFGRNAELSDTVPVALAPECLIPGALFYLDGHVLILGKVAPDGELFFLDATTHPSRDIYAHNGFNSVTGITPADHSTDTPYAGCYRGFRIPRFPKIERDAAGNPIAVRRRSDEEMQEFGYSLEQYDRLEELIKTGAISWASYRIDTFHDYVRARLRTVPKYCPMRWLDAYTDVLHRRLEQRVQRVADAWAEVQNHGVIPGPESPRETIFSLAGRWGEFSTAVEDVEIRRIYFEMQQRLAGIVRWYAVAPDEIDLGPYNGRGLWGSADLVALLIAEKNRLFLERSITYINSLGQPQQISLRDIEGRLFDLSYNPNHPPELRWGAPQKSEEWRSLLQFCSSWTGFDSDRLLRSYYAEHVYRSLIHRDPDTTALPEVEWEKALPAATNAGVQPSPLADFLYALWRPTPAPPVIPAGVRYVHR